MAFALRSDFVPRFGIIAMLALTTFGFLLMPPYFGYVFWFLEPENIIDRIRMRAIEIASTGLRLKQMDDEFDRLQSETLATIEELTDITTNSIVGKDKIIASMAVDAIRDFCLDYLKRKQEVPGDSVWFRIGQSLRSNPDFVAMDPESLQELEERKHWVEWKAMRQYLAIYNESLVGMRDINYLIAIDTRYIGDAAIQYNDDELIRLVFRFMNSYLRAALNARDVRTAYNVLNQYRIFLESLLRSGRDGLVLEGVRYMVYYGHLSYDIKIGFVTETVAYDIGMLCQYAHEIASNAEAGILQALLDLDRPLRSMQQEAALLGIRKAQVKLGAYYLFKQEQAMALTIAQDVAQEAEHRLAQVRAALEETTSKDFWEIIDRGRNFDYMPSEHRSMLEAFLKVVYELKNKNSKNN
ncbi:MAG: DUF2254 domain-containing protein [Deltaproteobacteria bacterium]|nr:DUF2254 domain-containing protein [Deltaproteobacteria bacterium]